MPTTTAPPDQLSETDVEISRWVTKAHSRTTENMSALGAFQRQMENYPQLSHEAQLDLASRVRRGAHAEETLSQGRKLSTRQQEALRREAKEGRRAMEYLAGSNFRLAMVICRELAEERYGRERALEMLSDLIGEANLALTEAMRRFEPELCPVFSTYAARVMRDRVRASLSQDGPVKMTNSWHRLKRIAAVRLPQLATELGRPPTMDEAREHLLEQCMAWAGERLTEEQKDLPHEQRHQLMLAKLKKQGMIGAIRELDDVLIASQSVASLDASLGDDNNHTLGDTVASQESQGFDDVELEELRRVLTRALAEFSDRERTIVLLRFGFTPEREPWTYGAIGERFGVTAERIRQIERGVLTKLSQVSPMRDILRAFLT